MFKHLLLVTLGIPCTYVSAMDNPFKSDYHHPYTRIIGEDNKNDFLYLGLGNEQAKRNLKAFNIELAQKKGIFSEIRARLTESSSSKPSKQ